MAKLISVTLNSKYGTGRAVVIKVPAQAEVPYLLTPEQNAALVKRAGLALGDYFPSVAVGYGER